MICDEIDNDCDDAVDEERVDVPWFVDADGDGYGDDSLPTVLSCVPIEGRAVQGGDCDESNPDHHPFAAELCDGIDNNCSSGGGADPSEDPDGDMHSAPGAACAGGYPKDDCDETSADIYGGAPEPCNRIDNDCSSGGGVDELEDADGDGHAPVTATCVDGPLPADDCDDSDNGVHPGATELCNLLDEDCSSGGGADPDEDADEDGFAPTGACTGGTLETGDCDDTDAAVYPGAPEVCDRIDSDCSSGGGVEPSEDEDRDGFTRDTYRNCEGGFPKTDCDDRRAESNPDGVDICNSEDDDCDGTMDNGCARSIEAVAENVAHSFVRNASGPTDQTSVCPSGRYLVGIEENRRSAGGFLEVVGVSPLCLRPNVRATADIPHDYVVDWGFSSPSTGSLIGDTEVMMFDEQRTRLCPDDTFLVSISRTKLECAPMIITGTQGDYTLSTGPIGVVGSGSGTLGSDCPDGAFIASLRARWDGSGLYAEYVCEDMGVVLR